MFRWWRERERERGGYRLAGQRSDSLSGEVMASSESAWSLVFTYGTLKRGFSNHVLMEDLIRSGDASYVGVYRTRERFPLVCGPYRVPFLLNFPGRGQRVYGEVYAVTPRGIARMDELEGTARGHYERLPLRGGIRTVNNNDDDDCSGGDEEEIAFAAYGNRSPVQAYFGHRSYAEDLWLRNGEHGFHVYSAKEARGYVRRKDRPQGTTFLDQIRSFLMAAAVAVGDPSPPALLRMPPSGSGGGGLSCSAAPGPGPCPSEKHGGPVKTKAALDIAPLASC